MLLDNVPFNKGRVMIGRQRDRGSAYRAVATNVMRACGCAAERPFIWRTDESCIMSLSANGMSVVLELVMKTVDENGNMNADCSICKRTIEMMIIFDD